MEVLTQALLRSGTGAIVSALPVGSQIGEPRKKIRIEPVDVPVPSETPAEAEPVKEPVTS